ncbi:MAG TPA: CPBP family intramembrane glutamic endopeptidase [Candidatus Dormibacteraeota bacterium]|nr:CPBP family intramembrane glutamic endopeptidase [Candidatus Dormibacteraeota bacterium]
MEHLAAVAQAGTVQWEQLGPLLLPVPVIVVANLAERARLAQRTTAGPSYPMGWTLAGWYLLGAVGAACALLGLVTLAAALVAPGGREYSSSPATYGAVILVTGIAAGTILLPPTRRELARFMPIDPDSVVHATALVLTIVLVGMQLATQLAVDLLAQQARSAAPLAPLDLVLQELPFLIAAVLGAGLLIRRRPAAVTRRLGLVRPSAWQVLLALGAAGAFYAFGLGMDALGHAVTVDVARKVDAANQRLFGRLDDPAGIATIALAAGICEETLFRGALQPKLGIVWTSIVFAVVHTQYGLSLDTVAVFILAIGLGLLRRVANTTTSTICHVAYNALVGVGVSGALIGPAVAVEAVLALGGLTAVFTGKLGSLRTAP